VQVPPPETGETDAQEAAIDRVIELLLDTKAVRSAEVLEPDEIAALLEPWLGAGATHGELPMPTLISVGVDPAAAPDYRDLARRLAEAAPGTVLDDHQSWLGQLLDLARAIELVAALIVILVGASAVAMVIFATRMGLAIHGRVIELLHLIGAQDAYVAHEFEAHALKHALRGGVAGLLLAIATVALVARLFKRLDSALLPELTLSPMEWAALAALPLAIALVAMLTARFTVLGNLGRMP
jgi:cell division transport system permease protein